MTEIELKFQVPPDARAAVSRAAASGRAGQTRLQAVYFDTPDRRLAAAGIAVRLRLEGTQWVQTAKAGDPHAMQRHEHNVPVEGAPDGPPPDLDLTRHDHTPAGTLIARALGGATLVPLYRTDIQRTHRIVHAGRGTIELALDVGEITAGDLRWPVHELEIELVDGEVVAVLDAAACWVRRHGLWLDVRSKAERGDRLARRVTLGEPVPGRVFPAGASVKQVAATGLAHLLPNASEVASGEYAAGHLHQLRLALRRLAAALRTADANPAWVAALSTTYRATRDTTQAAAAARAPAFTQALLALQALVVLPDGQAIDMTCNVDDIARS
jgi:inorganic triphosphatase YgiF